eukprot:jgi/Chrzof1/10395/Cz04g40110.t1
MVGCLQVRKTAAQEASSPHIATVPALDSSNTTAAAIVPPAAGAVALTKPTKPAATTAPSSLDANGTAIADDTTGLSVKTKWQSSRNPACCDVLKSVPAFTTNLPVIIINTHGQKLEDTKNEVSDAELCTCGAPNGSDYDDIPIQINVRGSSSVKNFHKKSYALKSLDAPNSNTDANCKFMGFPSHSDWILYGPEGDHTMMRNWMAYNLWRRIPGRWASRTAWAEVFLIDDDQPLSKSHYIGLYMAGEQIERGKNRIDIPKHDESVNPTGSLILRIEHGKPHDVPSFETDLTKQIVLVQYPKKNVSDTTLTYITKFVNSFEKELLKPNNGNHTAYATEDSLVDFFLGSEIIKSPDGYRGSVYFWKPPSGRLVMGTLWDADDGLGICCGFPVEGYQASGQSNGISGGSAISINGWLYNICVERQRCKIDPLNGVSQWYLALWQNPEFRNATNARWQALRKEAWSDAWLSNEVKSQATIINSAVIRDYDRWGQFYAADTTPIQFPTRQEDFTVSVQQLHDWVLARVRWLDQQIAMESGSMTLPQPATATAQPAAATAAVPAASSSPTATAQDFVSHDDDNCLAVQPSRKICCSTGNPGGRRYRPLFEPT